MSDAVIVALITTAGSVIVAFLTVYYGNKPKHDKDAELEREIEELKKEMRQNKHDKRNH